MGALASALIYSRTTTTRPTFLAPHTSLHATHLTSSAQHWQGHGRHTRTASRGCQGDGWSCGCSGGVHQRGVSRTRKRSSKFSAAVHSQTLQYVQRLYCVVGLTRFIFFKSNPRCRRFVNVFVVWRLPIARACVNLLSRGRHCTEWPVYSVCLLLLLRLLLWVVLWHHQHNKMTLLKTLSRPLSYQMYHCVCYMCTAVSPRVLRRATR